MNFNFKPILEPMGVATGQKSFIIEKAVEPKSHSNLH